MGRSSGSFGCQRALATACSATRRRDSRSVLFVVARAVRPSTTALTETWMPSSATFWWMVLLAKRVRADWWVSSKTSVSSAPLALRTTSKISRARASLSIGDSDKHVAEARLGGPVAGPHGLHGLALAAVGRAPERPVAAVADGVARVPELGGDAAVRGVLDHAGFLAALDLPGDLGAELEVVAAVVDAPAAVGLEIDAVVGVGQQVGELPGSRQQADVGHADERDAVPALGAHGAARAGEAEGRGGLARAQVADEAAVLDDVDALRRHALVVVAEGAEAGAVLEAGGGHHRDNLGAGAEFAELVEGEEAHPGEVRLHPQHAVELDGMADGLVDLQAELGALEEDGAVPFRALGRLVQRYGFLAHAPGVLDELQALDELVARRGVLPAEGVRVAALLDFILGKRSGDQARAGVNLGLVDLAPQRAHEKLLEASKGHRGLGQGHAGNAAHLLIGAEEQLQHVVERNREGVFFDGGGPDGGDFLLGRERDVLLLHPGAGAGDRDGAGGGRVNLLAGQLVGGGKAPGALGEHAHAEAERLALRDAAHLAVLGGKIAVAGVEHAHVGVSGAACRRRVQRPLRPVFHPASGAVSNQDLV